MKKERFAIVLIILAIFIGRNGMLLIHEPIVDALRWTGSRSIIVSVLDIISLLPALLVMLYLHKPKDIIPALGLNQSIAQGFSVAAIATLPLLLFGLLFGTYNKDLTIDDAIYAAFLPGIVEEIYYRGFGVGQLYKEGKVNFLISSLLIAIVFGSSHLFQGTSLLNSFAVFGVTFFGSLFFSWLYFAWNFNIWVNTFFHILMNLYWSMFIFTDAHENASGSTLQNIARALIFVLAIGITITYMKRQGQPVFNPIKRQQ